MNVKKTTWFISAIVAAFIVLLLLLICGKERMLYCSYCRQAKPESQTGTVNIQGFGLRTMCNDCYEKYMDAGFFKRVGMELKMGFNAVYPGVSTKSN